MGGWPVGYLHNAMEEVNSGLPRTNPEEDDDAEDDDGEQKTTF